MEETTIQEKPKLPKHLGRPWLDALRSGKYEQTTGQLERDGKYCCLGVYCVVHELTIENGGLDVFDDGLHGYHFLAKHIGDSMVTKLYDLNDVKKKSFVEIADYIEQNIELV
jgi:hypothetical protein